jgi:NTP pyrophosphatase (non-canonical NTP hydrolase)
MAHINEVAKECHQNSVDHGFYENENQNVGEKIALIHSELSEALEANRKGGGNTIKVKSAILKGILEIQDDEEFKEAFKLNVKDTFEDELADAVIRIFDLAEWKGINIERHILAKHRFNKLRPHKHGKLY